MNDPVKLTIREKQHRHGVPLGRFLEIAGGIHGVAREVNAIINIEHDEPATAELVIVSVESGSMILGLEAREAAPAAFDIARDVIDATLNGLALLEREAVRPPYFSDAALRESAQIVRPLLDGIGEIRLERSGEAIVLTPRLGEHVRQILSPRGSLVSSIQGRLFRVNISRREIGVYDVTRKQAIPCMYPEEMFEEVRRLLNKPVRVFGKAQLDATGAILRMEVRRLEEGREAVVVGAWKTCSGATPSSPPVSIPSRT